MAQDHRLGVAAAGGPESAGDAESRGEVAAVEPDRTDQGPRRYLLRGRPGQIERQGREGDDEHHDREAGLPPASAGSVHTPREYR